MSSPPWDTIPLLALKCIIEHLEENDALAATSACRHWRSSMLMYEGRRNILRLPVLKIDKCDFLARIFKKHTRKLHILIDVEANEEINTFMCYILPQFLDSINLQEIVFIGPLYVNLRLSMPFAQLRKVITETLLYKHKHVLESFAVIGCEMSVVDENDRYVNSQVEYFSKPLSFLLEQPCAQNLLENTIISKSNINQMMFSNLKHIVFEYDLISTEALITLSKLDNFQMLSLNFVAKRKLILPRIEWHTVTPLFNKELEVAVNLIHLSERSLQQVIDIALCEDMPVTSLKAMFLQHFYMSLVMHVTQLYGSSLTEFVWADAPTPIDSNCRSIGFEEFTDVIESPYSHVNPFIYLSWQCNRLQRLVVHGYWICEYDLLGVTRLRPGLDLVVSSIFDSTSPLFEHPSSVASGDLFRVMSTDTAPKVIPVNKSVLKYVYYSKWGRSTHNRDSRAKSANKNWVISRKIYMSRLNEVQTKQLTPKNWSDLPDGLKLDATKAQQTEFIVSAVMQPWRIT